MDSKISHQPDAKGNFDINFVDLFCFEESGLMMKHFKKTVLASAVSLCLLGGAAMADSWTVTQNFTTLTPVGGAASVPQEVSGVSLVFDQNSNAVHMNLAANLIKADASSITAVKQVVNVNSANFDQSNTTGAFQLGNGLVSANATGGSIVQTFTAPTVVFTQSNAAGSVQSGNYVGIAP
ncbi:MAG: hypothetical protein ABFS56_25340 [Pseudomonadota bacterium]